MAYISYDKLWRSEFHNNVSAKDRVQDKNPKQLKLEVNDTYNKDEKKQQNLNLNNEYVVNKAYLATKLSKTGGHLSLIEKDYEEFKSRNVKQSEEVLIERAVKTTIQIHYDKGLFDNYDKTDELLKNIYLLTKITKHVDLI